MAEALRRIDPPGRGCTDCLTGYSRPAKPGEKEGPLPLPEQHERFRQYVRQADQAEREGRMVQMAVRLWAAVSYAARELDIDIDELTED